MALYHFLHLAFLSILIIPVFNFTLDRSGTEVVFVNALFRHGDRYPKHDVGESEWYPNDPYINYTFSPFGPGQLTIDGRRREYNIGLKLRDLYGNFLGDIYTPNGVSARTTNTDRTKMSLQLVLASLYPPPPSQQWHPILNWQPIPYSYVPKPQDGLLQPHKACPLYKQEYERNLQSSEVKQKIAAFQPYIKMLETHSGRNITSIEEVFHLYQGFTATTRLGMRLPNWATDTQLYPHYMSQISNLQYDLYSYNSALKRRNGGMLLRRIIDDMRKVVSGDSSMKGRKINLYSAHESNVNAFLQTLGILDHPHVPEYSSSVIVELIRDNAGQHYVSVLYYLGIPANIQPMTIPGCTFKCPLGSFIKLLETVTPTGDELDCDKTRA